MKCVMRSLSLGITLLLAALAVAPAFAEDVRIEAPAPQPERPTKLAPPSIEYETTRPDDASYYPPTPRVPHNPGIIKPTETETGRYGIAGWTSGTPAVGGSQSGYRDSTGVFALGFAFEWGGPPKRPIR